MNRFLFYSLLIFILIPLMMESAYATDTFSTYGFVNIKDVRGTGSSFQESITDGKVCVKRSGYSSFLQFSDGSGDACAYIDSSSRYTLSSVTLPASPTTVQYVIVTEGTQLDIRDDNNDFYTFIDPSTEIFLPNYNWVHNIMMSHDSDSHKALWVYSDWKEFTKFVDDEFDEEITLDLDVKYEENEFEDTKYDSRNRELTFAGDGLPLNDSNAVESQWIVFHEMSHHLLNDVYQDSFHSRSYPDTNCEGHEFVKVSNGGCAFSEGFADMMPHLILDDTEIEVDPYAQVFNIESPAYSFEGDWTYHDANEFHQGVTVEGRVGATMFDLLDRNNDNDENVVEDNDDFWEIVEFFTVNVPTDIDDFYNNWKNEHGYDSNLDDVYTLNTLSSILTNKQITNLETTTVTQNSLILIWNVDDSGAPTTSHEIFRSASPFVSIANVSSSTITYQDNGLEPNKDYQYKIRPYTDYGVGLFSEVINVKTAADSTSPRIDTINRQDPSTETTANSTLTFRITFDEDVSGVNQFDFETSGTATSSVTGFTANNATQYDVVATVTADGTVSLDLKSTGHGIQDTATTPNTLTNITPLNIAQTYTVTYTVPSAPTDLTSIAISATQIDMSWNAPADDGGDSITGYKIERNLNGMGFTDLIADTSSSFVTYSDTTLSENDNAKYRVSAINAIGTGNPSNVSESTTAPPPTKFQFTGIIRDFNADHPNMQEGCSPSCQIHTGIVGPLGSALDADGKPVFHNKDNDQTLTDADDFNQWYRTVEGINVEQPITVELEPLDEDYTIYSYSSGPGFFPIDDMMFGNEGRAHNYHFAIEFHSTFAFDEPTEFEDQSFTFTGDDDVWVYVDGTLVLDIGGVHPAKTKTFTASQLMAEPFNLKSDTIYDLDLFFAERQTVQSNFRIDTTINFDPSFTIGTTGSNLQENTFAQRTVDISSFRNSDRSTDDVTFYDVDSEISDETSVVKIEIPSDVLILKDASIDDDDNSNDDIITITESDRIPDPSVVSDMAGPLIEIGDVYHDMYFDKAVKVTLFDQVGNSAFYIDSENITHLISQCTETLADSPIATTYLHDNNLKECYHDSGSDLVIWTMHFTGFGSATSDTVKKSGGDNSWKTKPTFGISHTTNNPIVECGFSWDGICYDITDNWHTPFEKVDLITGKNYSATLKTYMQHPPLFMEIALVPELEQYYNSETKIEIIFDGVVNSYYGNYDDTATSDVPSIKSVSVIQKENIIDESILEATIHKVSCGFVEQDCYELQLDNIMFRDIPFFEKIGIQAVDTQRRTQITYLNEGFAFSGESLNPSKTVNIHHHSKTGLFEVVQLDKFDNLWSDEDGIIYTHNDVNTWIRLSSYDFERHQDLETSVMTRMHSEFESLVDTQRQIAEQTFAEKFGDYADDSVLTFTPMDITKHYDVIDRNSDAFEQSVLLQREIAQVYLDSLSSDHPE